MSRSVRCHHRRGHPIVSFDYGPWRWTATGRFLKIGSNPNDPPCALCGRHPTGEGYDACLGYIPGATSACCGHGVTTGHVKFPERRRIDLPAVLRAQDVRDGRYPHPLPSAGDT